jgi:hypothetical protein
VVLVSIRRDGDVFGRSTHTPAGDWAVPEERQQQCIVAMAGWTAEHASGEADDGTTYDSGDLSCVLSGLDQYAPSQIDAELGWAEQEAARIVSEHPHRVERLANELLKRGDITDAEEIRAIIEGASVFT